MQNKNKIIALVCATALLGANITFATSTETGSGMKMPIKAELPKMDYNPIMSQFIKKDLSTEDMNSLKEIVQTYTSDIKALAPVISSGSTITKENIDSLKEKIVALNTAFVEKVTPFINSTKLEEFKKFAEINSTKPLIMSENKMPINIGSGKTLPSKNIIKQQEIKKFLSQKTRDLFNKKLDQIPAEKQLEFYKKLITKIDLLISKSQAEKIKGMLQELKMITQEKIDTMSQSGEEQDTINELFDE